MVRTFQPVQHRRQDCIAGMSGENIPTQAVRTEPQGESRLASS